MQKQESILDKNINKVDLEKVNEQTENKGIDLLIV